MEFLIITCVNFSEPFQGSKLPLWSGHWANPATFSLRVDHEAIISSNLPKIRQVMTELPLNP
jgi:hypothetical protein